MTENDQEQPKPANGGATSSGPAGSASGATSGAASGGSGARSNKRGRSRGGNRGHRRPRQDRAKYFRQLPSVDEFLKLFEKDLSPKERALPRPLLLEACREAIEDTRQRINAARAESLAELDLSPESLLGSAHAHLSVKAKRSLTRVINATGVVLHTNLGRSLLAREAQEAAVEAAASYVNLELDVATGQRGSRLVHVEGLLAKLTGAEAAIAVNNNAAAVLLVLDTFARGGEAIVSRGQLVEIGGSFRLPNIMEKSGCHLVEVGTTNKTYLSDYEEAISPATNLLLRVHTSNFKVVGFTADVPTADLVGLGRRYNIPVLDDLGSGCLIDLTAYGIPGEPTPQASVAAGADLVTFSGDKLLGGPQAGLVVGRRKLIDALRRNPLMRAIRLDKVMLAALEATLRLYAEGEARTRVPVLAMLTASPTDLEARARSLAQAIRRGVSGVTKKGDVTVEVAEGTSPAGGGALPGVELPTRLVAIRSNRVSAAALEERLRLSQPPVLARIRQDQILLDPRTILEGDEDDVVQALRDALSRSGEGGGD